MEERENAVFLSCAWGDTNELVFDKIIQFLKYLQTTAEYGGINGQQVGD
jgi:hypothetical protein